MDSAKPAGAPRKSLVGFVSAEESTKSSQGDPRTMCELVEAQMLSLSFDLNRFDENFEFVNNHVFVDSWLFGFKPWSHVSLHP
jgi:hypothetical protein